jgi:hypothetical protein
MAIINKTGITNGGTIQAEHVTRTIDALSGVSTDTIIATGSFSGSFTGPLTSNQLKVTGSINLLGSLNVNNSAGAAVINSSAYSLFRASGFTSIDWNNGAIYDSANNAAIQVDNNTIYDINNLLSIDWQNRLLRDSAEVVSQDYTSRILYDSAGAPIINYSQAAYVQLDAVLSLEIRTTTPAAGSTPTGSIMVSGSGVNVRPYFFTGTTWREISLL